VPRIPSRPSSARSGAASSDPGRPEDAKANKSRSASPAAAAPSGEVACHEAEIDLGPEDTNANKSGSASPAAATPVGEVARHGETSINSNAVEAEILRIGDWSVRRTSELDPCASPIYVHLKTGEVLTEPPPEVLNELAKDADVNDFLPEDPDQGAAGRELDELEEDEDDELDDAEAAEADDYFPSANSPSSGPPRFRRIVLGKGNVMPLRMARDLLTALREDPSLFDQLQQRFSDTPSEPVMEFHPGANGRPVSPSPGAPPPPVLPQNLEAVAEAMQPGEFSDVVGTDSGMQILLRVS